MRLAICLSTRPRTSRRVRRLARLLQTSEKVFARRPIRQQASLAGFSSASLDLFPEFQLQAQRTPQYLLALTAELREHSVEPLDLCVCFLELRTVWRR